MGNLEAYRKARERLEAADERLHEVTEALSRSPDQNDREIAAAIKSDPERVKIEGLPLGSGVSFAANYAPAASFRVARQWEYGAELSAAILERAEARLQKKRAHERLSFVERAGATNLTN